MTPADPALIDRFRPTRAGIIGLWDYTDQVFEFAGGRLLLRGANGSGKTKALELLFPFVLDARLDPRRLDPFSGEGRTMKQNVLWRGRDANYGYVWLEFASDEASGERRTVTVGVGLQAHADRDQVRSWFFVTDRVVGETFDLVDGERRPLSRKQLIELLDPGEVVDRGADHRAAVDRALFGLGPDRYESLLQLVLFLRRPQLARELDVSELARILTEGLRPLDEELLGQSARSFEDLEAVQRELELLVAARGAVDQFLDRHRAYLRVRVRERVELVLERRRGRDQAQRSEGEADRRVTEADAGLVDAEKSRNVADRALIGTRSETAALRDSDAYRAAGQLTDLEGRARDTEAEVAELRSQVQLADGDITGLETEFSAADEAIRSTTAESGRTAGRTTSSAVDAGVAWSLPGDAATPDEVDPGELDRTASGLRAARTADLRAVRQARTVWERADTHRRLLADREAEAEAKANEADEAERSAEAAQVAARDDLVGAMARWATGHDLVDAAGVERLVEAARSFVEPTDQSPAGLASQLLAPARDEASARLGHLRGEREEAEAELADLALQREALAGERDDNPPAPHTRSATRDQRAGAPLWRLVDFTPGLNGAQRANLESAMESAGLLDAWVSPDGRLEDAVGDAFLVALDDDAVGEGDGRDPDAGRPGAPHPTLTDVLVPDAGAGVSHDVVARLLKMVTLGEIDSSPVAVDVEGGFRLGPLMGSWHKDQAQYIGAAARAENRRLRLLALDEQRDAVVERVAQIAADHVAAVAVIDRIEAALAEVPGVEGVLNTSQALAGARAMRRQARSQLEEAANELARVTSVAETEHHRLLTAGRERRLGIEVEALDETEQALDRFTADAHSLVRAVTLLVQQRNHRDQLVSRLDQRREARTHLAERLGDRQRARDEVEQRLATLRQTIGSEAADVLARIDKLEASIVELDGRYRAAVETVTDASAEVARADENRGNAAARSAEAADSLHDAAQRLTVLRRPDLQAVLGLDPHDGDASEDASDERIEAGLTDDGTGEPPRMERLVGLLDAATDGVAIGEERVKGVTSGVLNAFQKLEQKLGSRFQPELDSVDDLLVVSIADETGPSSAVFFAARLGSQVDEQSTLLTERERRVFEDTLLTSLCSQINERIHEARDQLHRMNVSLREHQMSSGMTVQLAWPRVDDLTPEASEAASLLEQDPALLSTADRDRLRDYFAAEIRLVRAAEPGESYLLLLTRVLDYRRWHTFTLRLVHPDGRSEQLTKRRFNKLSGGERSTSLHLPLFAAATAHYSSGRATAPRLIALDEAFAGIDEATKATLMGLAVEFDLDMFLTGHDLWGTYPTVPELAIYDLVHLRAEHVVDAQPLRWDGHELAEIPTGP